MVHGIFPFITQQASSEINNVIIKHTREDLPNLRSHQVLAASDTYLLSYEQWKYIMTDFTPLSSLNYAKSSFFWAYFSTLSLYFLVALFSTVTLWLSGKEQTPLSISIATVQYGQLPNLINSISFLRFSWVSLTVLLHTICNYKCVQTKK